MKTKPIAALLTAVLAATMVSAQPPGPKPSPEPSAKPRPAAEKPEPPPRPGQLANVRIDVKITDERPGQPPVSKAVSLTVADRRDGFVRASGSAMGTIPLNVDASPVIEGSRIRLVLALLYSSIDGSAADKAQSRRDFQQRLGLVLEDGKTVQVTHSSDPVSDRYVNVDVTATILR